LGDKINRILTKILNILFVNFLDIFLQMVNITTALQSITEFINQKGLSQMKKWSERKRYRKNGYLMRNIIQIIQQLKKILVLISGNDVIEMLKGMTMLFIFKFFLIIISFYILLKDLLNKEERDALTSEKYKGAIINLVSLINN
jgi:hypothetical protein